MKNRILAALAALTCGVFVASPVSCFGASLDWVEVVAETVFSALVQGAVTGETNGSDGKGLTGVAEQFIDISLVPAMYDRVAQTADNLLTFTIPNYRLITGKYQLKSTFAEYSGDDVTSTTTEDVLVECTMVVSDSYPNNFDLKTPFGVDKNTGVAYYANALNYSIYYTDGTIDRFVCLFRKNVYSEVSGFGSTFVSLSQSNYCDVYDYSATKLQRVLYTNQWTAGIRFYMNDSNTINRELTTIAPRPSSVTLLQYPVGLSSWSSTSSQAYRLNIRQWTEGRASAVYLRPSSYTGSNRNYAVNFYPINWFYTSFAITNNNTDENSINRNWTTNNYQNYYVDNTFEGGKVINNDNKTTILGGALAPAFDIDTDLPFDEILDLLTDLLPDIKANLKPEIGVDIESLFDRLFDFYSNMPDIGLPWGDDDTNNYWDIQPPAPPDDGGGGTGDITVNVDITRPKIPYIDTNPQITLYVPTVTTTALPPSVISAGKDFVDWGKEITDMTGTTSIIVTCGLVGVGVMLIFKDW